MRERILCDFARLWVQAANEIHLLGRKPHITVLGDSQGVGRRFGARQGIFLKRFGLWIEAANLAGAKFGKPDNSIGSGLNAARQSRRGRLIACDLVSFRVDLEQLARGSKAVEPHVVIPIDVHSIRVWRRLRIIGELFGFRIEAAEWGAAGPYDSFGIDAKRVLRSALPFIFERGIDRILILGDSICFGVLFTETIS
jgi:hypothetical protein